MNTIKRFALTLLFAAFSINTHASATDGTIMTSTGLAQGGSNVTFTWHAPSVPLNYKVWIQVPTDGTASNALYHVYPKGNSVASNSGICSSTDVVYPCFEVSLNQAINRGKWAQLTVGTDKTTAWKFTKNGFVSVNASNLSSTEFLSAASISFEDATPLAIGQTYRGGIIFYIDNTRKHGLIAAPYDIKDSASNTAHLSWYDGVYSVTGVVNTAVGFGQSNTTALVTALGAGHYAAKACDDLVIGNYSDWYLPSKEELNLMYKAIGAGASAPLTNMGHFLADYYWSSSELDARNSWIQQFGTGAQVYADKASAVYVRAIRAF